MIGSPASSFLSVRPPVAAGLLLPAIQSHPSQSVFVYLPGLLVGLLVLYGLRRLYWPPPLPSIARPTPARTNPAPSPRRAANEDHSGRESGGARVAGFEPLPLNGS